MVTTQNDSFHLPDYEERLWDELRALHEHEQGERDQQGRRPGRFRRPRRTTYLGAAAAAVAVVGLVVTIVVTRGDGGGTETGPASESSTTTSVPPFPPPAPTGPLPDDSVDAIEVRDSGSLVQVRDEATGAYAWVGLNADGEIEAEMTWAPGPDAGTGVTTTVDHRGRRYREVVDNHDPTLVTTGWYQQQIEVGNYLPDGTEVIDGVELLRFVEPALEVCETDPELEEVCAATGNAEDHVVWMDPESMRPVQAGSGSRTTSTFTYLPRTPENLALVEVVVPEGYERVESFDP